MPEELFGQYDLAGTFKNHKLKLSEEADSLNENEVLNASQADMADYLVARWRIEPVEIDEEGITAEYGDVQTGGTGNFYSDSYRASESFKKKGTRFTFHIPFAGDPDIFKFTTPHRYLVSLQAMVKSDALIFTYDLDQREAEKVKSTFDQDLGRVYFYLNQINPEVKKFNESLPGYAKTVLDARREKLLRDKGIAESIGFPLRRKRDQP